MRLSLLVLSLTLAACDGGEAPQGGPGEQAVTGAPVGMPAMAPPMEMVLANSKVVDLTHGLAADIPVQPGSQGVVIEPIKQHQADGELDQRITLGERSGTHVDAPLQYVNTGTPVSDLSLDELVGAAAVVDVVAAVSQDPGYAVTVADLQAWEQRHGELSAGTIVLVRTGWAARWNDAPSYLGQGADEGVRFPGLSLEAATWLVEKGVKGVGVDTPSCDPGASTDAAVHKQLLGAGGYCVANLARLEQLPEAGCTVIVAPLPIVGGGGAPARVLAIVPTGCPSPVGGQPGGFPATPGTAPGTPGGAPGEPGAQGG